MPQTQHPELCATAKSNENHRNAKLKKIDTSKTDFIVLNWFILTQRRFGF